MQSLIEDEPAVNDLEDVTALGLLQRIYQCRSVSLHIRMRAAAMAIPYESCKLLATAIIQDNDIATLLDRRIARIQEMERTKLIEHAPTNGNEPTNGERNDIAPPVEIKPPTPSINHRAIRLKRRI
jgi:hypothetical protein